MHDSWSTRPGVYIKYHLRRDSGALIVRQRSVCCIIGIEIVRCGIADISTLPPSRLRSTIRCLRIAISLCLRGPCGIDWSTASCVLRFVWATTDVVRSTFCCRGFLFATGIPTCFTGDGNFLQADSSVCRGNQSSQSACSAVNVRRAYYCSSMINRFEE